jgi:hypothetical protein
MSEDFDVKQRTQNIYERWRLDDNKELSDKHSKEDGEMLEKFYNRLLLMRQFKLKRLMAIRVTQIVTPNGTKIVWCI